MDASTRDLWLTFGPNMQDSNRNKWQNAMTRQQILDLYFLDARHKLVEIAAFLDRLERADGADDFRLTAFHAALAKLAGQGKSRARDVLLTFSDHSIEPVAKAPGKGAVGAVR